jgi:hypothetical protein|tara:strand:- start:208 stop:540 length:333 start_codon:yes stop_codon:yes gene_type:complete
MRLKLPLKIKIKYLTKNKNNFEGKVIFHDKEYSMNIHAQKNEKVIKVPFSVLGVTDNEILVRLSSASGVYVQDHVKFKGTEKNLEIDSELIFQEILNNKIKFDTLEIFVK